MDRFKPLSLLAVIALLGGCAGQTISDLTPAGQEPLTGTWEGNYICGAASKYQSIPSVARLTFASSGPDLSMVASLIGVAQSVSEKDFGNLKPLQTHDFAGTAHYTLNSQGQAPRGGTTKFSGYKDRTGQFFITQEQFVDYFGGANSGNLFPPKMSGTPNADGTMSVSLCDTTMILRKVSG